MSDAGAPDMAERIKAQIAEEIASYDTRPRSAGPTLEAFRKALRDPKPVTVNFSGGITQTCWSVTRPNGPYRVIYLPTAGYFSLCVESDFGPLDIGVHGNAIGCYASV